MIRPAHFGYNFETGQTNTFQNRIYGLEDSEIQHKALQEFDLMVQRLKEEDINVLVIQDEPTVIRPDAIFPNNWISLHQDGTVITYPMQSANRRLERREEIIDQLSREFNIKKRFSLEIFEDKNQYLEGTGSMIFDHQNQIVYACLSPRTNVELLTHLATLLNYRAVYFDSKNEKGIPIYHTNVMMALGLDFVIICLDSVSLDKKSELIKIFEETGKDIIEISFEQMNQFAGNMLQVSNKKGVPVLIMSQTAFESLTPEQIIKLKSRTKILPVTIPTIETIGGGSARCMMAENFLTPK